MTQKTIILTGFILFAGMSFGQKAAFVKDLKATPAAIGSITVYKDANLKGESKKYSMDVPLVGNDWNDVISSIHIPQGYRVTIFRDANFQGPSLTLTADWNATDEWNDQVSSIRIVKIIDTRGKN